MSGTATHPFSAEAIMAFCDGEIAGVEARAIEAHIAACAECQEEVRKFRENSQSLGEWSAPPFPVKAEEIIEEHLDGKAFGHKSRRGFGRAGGRGWRPWAIAGVSTVAALLLIGVFVLRQSELAQERAERASRTSGIAAIGGEENSAGDAYVDGRNPRAAVINGWMWNDERSAGLTGSPTSQPPPPPPTSNGPMIARSVSYLIVAKDVVAARPALEAILSRCHGYAAQITVYTPASDSPSLKASLRIPVANLGAAMRDLRGLGRVASESESGEDVTQQHIDLDQRLKTARDTEDRFRAILEQRTGNVSDVLQVEEGIARVRGEIESMEAEQTNLQHRVDFASIDLSVDQEYSAATGTGAAPVSVRVRNAFVAGYRNAVGTVVGIFLFLVEYGLAILIWVAILAVPIFALRRRYRRLHAKF